MGKDLLPPPVVALPLEPEQCAVGENHAPEFAYIPTPYNIISTSY